MKIDKNESASIQLQQLNQTRAMGILTCARQRRKIKSMQSFVQFAYEQNYFFYKLLNGGSIASRLKRSFA